MKKLFSLALLLTLCVGSASARKPIEYKEPRVRFGIGYRYSMALREQYKAVTSNQKRSAWVTPDQIRGGEFLLEATVRVTPDWNVGLGVGAGSYDGNAITAYKTYLKGERLYGKRASRWFNYANIGTTYNTGPNIGLTAELGGGYRLAMTRRTRLDLTIGLEYLNVVGKLYDLNSGESFSRGARINRYGLTFGIAMHF